MKRLSSIVAALLAIGALLAPAASAAPGDLDPSFGAGGSERLFPSVETIALRGVAVQPDGKPVLAGADQTTNSVLVVRLLANGALDPSFGNGGIVNTPFPAGSFGEGRAVAIQSDGRIVVAGGAKGAVNGDFLALRYLENGAPDTSFGGGDGIEIAPIGAGQDRAQAVALGASGRILLTGEARLPENKGDEVGVAVLQSDGKPDPSFGTGGVKTLKTTAGEPADEGQGIAEQTDGKIVIADESGVGAGNGFTIVRLLAGGGLDPEFGGTGVVNTPIPSATNPGARGRSSDVLVQPDGRIVAAGYGYDEVGPKAETDPKFAAVRYLSDGKPDPSFGAAGSGIFTHQVAPGEDVARRVLLTPNGKLILAGPYSPTPNDNSLAVLRLTSAGVLDPTFGSGGVALRGPTALFGNFFDDAALDSRERVVVASRDYIGNGNTEVEVSRFLGDVPPDPAPAAAPPQYTPQQPIAKPPHARMKAVPRKLQSSKLTRFSGTAADPDGGAIAKVQIALVRAASAKAGGAATCQELANAKGRFKTVKATRGNCPLHWLKAKGTAKWRFKLKTVLPPGRYVVYSRAVDASGLAETTFSRGAGSRYGFRLLAPEPKAPKP